MVRLTEYKAIGAKLPVDEYLLIDKYCKMQKVSASSLIRKLLLEEINITVPQNVAGKNHFEYNSDRDTFSWFVLLDDGKKVEVLRNVSPEYLKELHKVLEQGLTERKNATKQKNSDSVAIPSKIMKVKK